ncbi:lysylphosphatidylglycerol synthase transmembrane domain-containing protein [Haloferax sp. DFSO60]|uniref:lysylphosphatidylglycerol synthase transmembrane domain-containing protein n=1 Tax=Haloferax sp. DFSO60 TaxID=3388652 RepID=UPI0039793E3D
MPRENIRATILGFLAAFVVFAVLFYFAGVDELVARLTTADPLILAAILGVSMLWLVAWGTSLKTVLGVLGVQISVVRSFLVFTGAMFSNNITPFGQAGGEPVTALLISRSTETEYETGLAAIASVDTLNFVPSITIALIGAGYYATEVTLGRNLEIALVAVGVLAIGVPTLVYTAWQRRYELETRVIEALTPVIRTIAEYVPRVSVPSVETVKGRIAGFFRSIERVGQNPRGLTVALGLSGLGWFCQMVALWLAFQAIGAPIAFSIALFVVPIGAIAGVTPLPGGAGGIEWTLAILVTAASPAVSFDVATAGVVLFRGFVYWVPTLLGGLVMGVEGTRGWGS